jgi:hypothetical protein
MIVPVHRKLAESLDPITKPLASDPQRLERLERWKQSRLEFNAALAANDPEVVRQGWQRSYMLGMDIDGQSHPQHQTRLALRPFRSIQPQTDANESSESSARNPLSQSGIRSSPTEEHLRQKNE